MGSILSDSGWPSELAVQDLRLHAGGGNEPVLRAAEVASFPRTKSQAQIAEKNPDQSWPIA